MSVGGRQVIEKKRVAKLFIILTIFLSFADFLYASWLCMQDQTIYPDFDTCAQYCEDVWCVEQATYICLSGTGSDDRVPPPEEIEYCVQKPVCPLDYHLSCSSPPIYFKSPDCRIENNSVCSCGYSFNAAMDWCEKEEINICDPGYTFSDYYSQKYGVHVCVAPYYCPYGSYDPSDERCETSSLPWHWQCPVNAQYGCANYFGTGMICGNVGSCSAVTDDNGTIIGYECSLGGFYSDASSCSSNCYESWSCYKEDDCPPGTSPDWGQGVCYTGVRCPGSGTFYPPEELCYVYAQIECPSCSGEAADRYDVSTWGGYNVGIGSPVFDPSSDKCLYGPFCPWPPPEFPYLCPEENLDYTRKRSVYKGSTDVCSYIAECIDMWTCPSDIDKGCVDAGVDTCYIEDPVDESYYQNDGSYDNNTGECLGSIYIFNGRPLKCRPPGYSTGFHNCCDADDDIVEDVRDQINLLKGTLALVRAAPKIADAVEIASTAIKAYEDFQAGAVGAVPADYWQIVQTSTSATDAAQKALMSKLGISPTSVLAGVALSIAIDFSTKIIFGGCNGEDVTTAAYKENGLCHYVGKKCIKKLPIIGCVQKAKVYCCFNSVLARIIHEQGRPQLETFGPDGGWGTAKEPDCRGFRPEEFQMIDFSKIDFSEYVENYSDSLIERMPENTELEQKMKTKVQNFFGSP